MTLRCLRLLLPLAASFAITSVPAQVTPVQLYAAGSLRDALTEVARQFETQTGQKVALTFGAQSDVCAGGAFGVGQP